MQKEDMDAVVGWTTSIAVMGMVGYMMRNMTKAVLGDVSGRSDLLIPQTGSGVTATVHCPICGKRITIPGYDPTVMTRSEALRRHIELEHTSRARMHPKMPLQTLPQVMIKGGELVPYRYRDLIGLISEPLPDYSLLVLPAVVPGETESKVDAVLKQLKAGVEGIQESSQFRLFLTTMAKFHDYSIGNQILIMLQKPEATRVAGFNTWKDLGRWVKKSERGIAILAPVMPPRPTCPRCGSRIPKGAKYCPDCGEPVEIEIEASPRYFRVVYVFEDTPHP